MENIRLANDYARVRKMVNPNYVTIREMPHPEQEGYGMILRFDVHNIRSMGSPDLQTVPPSPVNQYCFKVCIPASYPNSAIKIHFDKVHPRDKSIMLPYVPNVFEDGDWCYGGWVPGTSRLDLIIPKLLRSLVLDPHPQIMNFKSRANTCTDQWFEKNKGSLPCFPPNLLFADSSPSIPAPRIR